MVRLLGGRQQHGSRLGEMTDDSRTRHQRSRDCEQLLNRRQFLAGSIQQVLALALASTLLDRALASNRGQDRIATWFEDYLRLGRELATSRIAQTEWQEGIDRLHEQCRMDDLLRWVDYDAVLRTFEGANYNGRGELFHTVRIDGQPAEIHADEPRRTLITKIAHVKKGGSIPPHGHENMVSAFLHLSGEIRVHHYDKVEDVEDALIVRKANEHDAIRGDYSSISDQRRNVHWLEARSEDCFLFSTKMSRLEIDRPVIPRIYVDVDRATMQSDGTMHALKISADRAVELYG